MSEIKEFSAMSLWNNLSTNKKMAAILSEPAQHIQKKKKKKKIVYTNQILFVHHWSSSHSHLVFILTTLVFFIFNTL